MANESSALNSSLAGNVTSAHNSSGNITLANSTAALNSSVEAHNVTLANNSSGNMTMTNNSTGQNSSVEAHNVTMANITGNSSANAATNKSCFKTVTFRRKSFVKVFILWYSDNGKDWKKYHEGGAVKVCLVVDKKAHNSWRFHLPYT